MSKRPRKNFESPWGPLSRREVQIMDGLIKCGSHKMAAEAIHVSNKTFATYYARVREKMGIASGLSLLPVLTWDRWRRGEEVTVPNGEY